MKIPLQHGITAKLAVQSKVRVKPSPGWDANSNVTSLVRSSITILYTMATPTRKQLLFLFLTPGYFSLYYVAIQWRTYTHLPLHELYLSSYTLAYSAPLAPTAQLSRTWTALSDGSQMTVTSYRQVQVDESSISWTMQVFATSLGIPAEWNFKGDVAQMWKLNKSQYSIINHFTFFSL